VQQGVFSVLPIDTQQHHLPMPQTSQHRQVGRHHFKEAPERQQPQLCHKPAQPHLSMRRICSSFRSTAASVLRRVVTSAVQPSTSSCRRSSSCLQTTHHKQVTVVRGPGATTGTSQDPGFFRAPLHACRHFNSCRAPENKDWQHLHLCLKQPALRCMPILAALRDANTCLRYCEQHNPTANRHNE
jgi:hypothetical protein